MPADFRCHSIAKREPVFSFDFRIFEDQIATLKQHLSVSLEVKFKIFQVYLSRFLYWSYPAAS